MMFHGVFVEEELPENGLFLGRAAVAVDLTVLVVHHFSFCTAEKKSATPVPTPPASPKLEDLSENDRAIQERITKLNAILGGATTINLHLQFLIRNNKVMSSILECGSSNLTFVRLMFVFTHLKSNTFLNAGRSADFEKHQGSSAKFCLPHGNGDCQFIDAFRNHQ